MVDKLITPILSFAQSKSLVLYPFFGTASSHAFAQWSRRWKIDQNQEYESGTIPRQADVLVILGDISQKLAPMLMRTHAKMAQPSWVLQIRSGEPIRSYATLREPELLVPIDVILEGNPPSEKCLDEAMLTLKRLVKSRGQAS